MTKDNIKARIDNYFQATSSLRTGIYEFIKENSSDESRTLDVQEAQAMSMRDLIWWYRSDWSKR